MVYQGQVALGLSSNLSRSDGDHIEESSKVGLLQQQKALALSAHKPHLRITGSLMKITNYWKALTGNGK